MIDAFTDFSRQNDVVNIRRACPEDFPQLKPMLLDMGFVEDETSLAERFPAFCANPTHLILVADEAGKLLGYASVQDYGPHLRSGESHRTAKLDDLYTLPAARRRGIARKLMQAVTDWAQANPIRYVFWYANQGEAGRAYQAMGYQQPAPSGQDGFDFYEIDLGDPKDRIAHAYRGA